MTFDRIKLKQLRKSLGLNQTEAGQQIGIDQRQLSRYESGKNVPTKRNQEKLDRFFLRHQITTQ